MGTKAETIQASARPAGFTLWVAVVSALAAAALIMSAMALTVAARDRGGDPAGAGVDATATTRTPPWTQARLDAMAGRMLAERIRIDGYVPLWNAGKLDAMEGRMLAERISGRTG